MPRSSCGWRTPGECYGRDLPGGELSGQSFKGDPSPSWNPVVEFDGYELNDNRSFFQSNRSLFELDGDGTREDSDADYESTRPMSDTNSYVHVLPGLNMLLRLDERTNVRAALTRSLARPNYWDLVSYRLVSREDDELELGNPDLDVTTSTNVDLLFERYFQSIGLFSAGVFYKRLSDYIYESIYDVTSGPYAGYEAVQPVNGGNATLWGFEFAFNQQLTFLPGALSGLGIYANYTCAPSSTSPWRTAWVATRTPERSSLGPTVATAQLDAWASIPIYLSMSGVPQGRTAPYEPIFT